MSGAWLHRPCGDVRRDMLAQDGVGVDVLVEAGQHEPGRELAADLVVERVSELQRSVLFGQLRPFLVGQASRSE